MVAVFPPVGGLDVGDGGVGGGGGGGGKGVGGNTEYWRLRWIMELLVKLGWLFNRHGRIVACRGEDILLDPNLILILLSNPAFVIDTTYIQTK
jgi:hypothetical protein